MLKADQHQLKETIACQPAKDDQRQKTRWMKTTNQKNFLRNANKSSTQEALSHEKQWMPLKTPTSQAIIAEDEI